MLRPHSARRRSGYGPHICTAAAAILLLLSILTLHSRLSSSSSSSLPSLHSSDPDPLFDADADAEAENWIDSEHDDFLLDASTLDEESDSDDHDLLQKRFFWDHSAGVLRQSFLNQDHHHHQTPSNVWVKEISKLTFGSDDNPVDDNIRLKLDSVRRIEDALMLKSSPLRKGWDRWIEGKADFLRRDRMLRLNLDSLNPKRHPLLQDPDMDEAPVLTRGDQLVQRSIRKELEMVPFAGGARAEAEKLELRKTLRILDEDKEKQRGGASVTEEMYPNGRRWGYFPGIETHLAFSEFMDRFLGSGQCSMKVFMVWNTPAWMFGVRHQRGLESLLHHHKDACVVVFSETLELDFFKHFVKDGFKIAVAMPNLDELLKDTPTHVFASVWFEWRKKKYYDIHYSELIRLAALYKYGGLYLDSDIIVLRTLLPLKNSVGAEDQMAGKSIFNGAVMAFERHSPFLMECMREYYLTYDDTHLTWNGADLITRVVNRIYGEGRKPYGHVIKIEPPDSFFPISHSNITRYFVAAEDEGERAEQDALLKRILDESKTFHFWNRLTSALVPEPNSLVERLLNLYCLNCLDVM